MSGIDASLNGDASSSTPNIEEWSRAISDFLVKSVSISVGGVTVKTVKTCAACRREFVFDTFYATHYNDCCACDAAKTGRSVLEVSLERLQHKDVAMERRADAMIQYGVDIQDIEDTEPPLLLLRDQ